MSPSAQQASQDERLLAAIAHSGAMLPFLGFIIPLHIWITQRDWSKFVQFHALQALIYQLAMPSAFSVVYLFGIWGLYGSMLGGLPDSLGGAIPSGLLTLRCVLVGMVLIGWSLTLLLGLLGASRILAGRDFLYPLLGRWLVHYMEGNKNM